MSEAIIGKRIEKKAMRSRRKSEDRSEVGFSDTKTPSVKREKGISLNELVQTVKAELKEVTPKISPRVFSKSIGSFTHPYAYILHMKPLSGFPYKPPNVKLVEELSTEISKSFRHFTIRLLEFEFRKAYKIKLKGLSREFPKPSSKPFFYEITKDVFVPILQFSKSPEVVPVRLMGDTLLRFRPKLSLPKMKGLQITALPPPIISGIEKFTRVAYERPRVVIAFRPHRKKYEYIELLKRFLREIYRVNIGGLPKPRHLLRKKEAEHLMYIDPFDVIADRSIYVIEDRVDSLMEAEEVLKERLKEVYSQRLGFLVFYIDPTIDFTALASDSVRPVEVQIDEKLEYDSLCRYVGLLYGFTELDEIFEMEPESINVLTVELEERFYGYLESLLSEPRYLMHVQPAYTTDGRLAESMLHYAFKVLTFKFLTEKLGIPSEDIESEVEVSGVIPDILVRSRGLVVEIETLYGTGIPLFKLKRMLDERVNAFSETWVVIPSFQAIIYLRDLLYLRNTYRRVYGNKVEFYTFDIQKGKPIKLSKYVEKLLRVITPKSGGS
ncbi:hypothetical protein DRO58_04985 [Candidatus Bathyarchaeota archaeon]|nr:MAG: hypothetical protein DRO58_04985 [Candidatus Bathyarchaeota archaeon]